MKAKLLAVLIRHLLKEKRLIWEFKDDFSLFLLFSSRNIGNIFSCHIRVIWLLVLFYDPWRIKGNKKWKGIMKDIFCFLKKTTFWVLIQWRMWFFILSNKITVHTYTLVREVTGPPQIHVISKKLFIFPSKWVRFLA